MNELKHFLNKEFGRNQGLKVPSSEKKNIKANNKPGFQNYRMITKPKKPNKQKKSDKHSLLGLEITIIKDDDNLEEYLKPQSLTQKQETHDKTKKLFK